VDARPHRVSRTRVFQRWRRTWSEPKQAATVQNVNARFFLRRLKSGRILLVKNGSPAERLQKRTHMSAWLSEDEGQTWKGGLLLDERNAVSYPDGFERPMGSSTSSMIGTGTPTRRS
jgi:predicted neuraminidase